MKVLILGAKGLLGEALQRIFAGDVIAAYDREELDVTDFVKLRAEIARLRPDTVINCVAWNDVDGAEAEAKAAKLGQADRSMLLNCDVVREVAKICKILGLTLVTYSTDNVFNGEKSGGYVEEDTPCPINAYGSSKACGEAALMAETDNYYLIRTSRLYGEKPASGNAKLSFVSRMMELAEKNKELSVVDEEPGAFTYADDLAKATKKLIEDRFPFGIYHLAAEGAVTWFECAREIFAILGAEVALRPVRRKDYPRRAPVPKHSILANTKFPHLRNWKMALRDFLGDKEKIPCSVEILTLNSGQTLPALLRSVKDFSEIIVLDGGSADGTREVAKSFGCAVLDQPAEALKGGKITDFSAVRNKGLEMAKEPWFLFVDSDEIVSPELAGEIRATLKQGSNSDSVYEVPRKYIINGVLIENSITYPAVQVRLFRRDAVIGFFKPVHERVQARPGVRGGRLKNAIYVPQENIFFPQKWFWYLDIEAKKYKNFSFYKCVVITARRLAVSALYAWRYLGLLLMRKKNRAPWKFEASYIAYNFVHVFYMWRSRFYFLI